MILKTRLCLSCRVHLVPVAVKFYVLFIFLLSSNRILHCFAILSHFIFAINQHKGKWVIVLTNTTTLFFITPSTVCSTECYTLLLSDPNSKSRHLLCMYFRIFRVTYLLSIHQERCHLLFSVKIDTHFIIG